MTEDIQKKLNNFPSGLMLMIMTIIVQIVIGSTYIQSIKGKNEQTDNQIKNDERRIDELDRRMNISEEDRRQQRILLERIQTNQENMTFAIEEIRKYLDKKKDGM